MTTTTDPHGWPDASKPGCPANPERSGWHWLQSPRDFVRPCLWTPGSKTWLERGSMEDMRRAGWRYLGPCHTPAEVAALVEAAGREAIERAADYVAECFIELGLPLGVDSIRALAAPTPSLDAIRAEARREGMLAAMDICNKRFRADKMTLSDGKEYYRTHADRREAGRCAAAIAAAIEKEGE